MQTFDNLPINNIMCECPDRHRMTPRKLNIIMKSLLRFLFDRSEILKECEEEMLQCWKRNNAEMLQAYPEHVKTEENFMADVQKVHVEGRQLLNFLFGSLELSPDERAYIQECIGSSCPFEPLSPTEFSFENFQNWNDIDLSNIALNILNVTE